MSDPFAYIICSIVSGISVAVLTPVVRKFLKNRWNI